MRINKSFIFACVAMLGITAALAGGTRLAAMPEGVGPGHERAWREYIRDVGGKDAYATFRSMIAEKPAPTQHQDAHFFGAALFDALGVPGLSTCDGRFSFGCFHEFLGHAIRDLGLSVVTELNAGCKEALPETFLSCQHGIGHGIYAHLGYDEPSLFEALRICSTIPDADVIGGCYGGVFMEYNQRTMWGISAQTRPATTDMHYPCSVVDEEYVPACAYWMPQWWSDIERERGVSSRIERMGIVGERCVESRDRTNCFEGIGNIMLSESRDARGEPSVERVWELCSAARRSAADELRCLSIAANHFGIEVSRAEGQRVCSRLPTESRDYCEQYASNFANIANRIPFPEL